MGYITEHRGRRPNVFGLLQDNFLTQHVLETTRAAGILDIALSPQKEFVDNVVIQEPLCNSDHNQLHFNIKIKSDKTKVKQCRRDFRKGNYKEIRKSLAHIDWNDKMKNKMATECWNIIRGEIGVPWMAILLNLLLNHKTGEREDWKPDAQTPNREMAKEEDSWRNITTCTTINNQGWGTHEV